MRILIACPLAPALHDNLAAAGHDLKVVSEENGALETFVDELAQADGLLVNSHVAVDAFVISAAPHLAIISTVSVGLDHIDVDAARERSITVTNTPVLHDAVADLTMMLMTMLARRIPESLAWVRRGESWRAAPLGIDLATKTLLLVGFGRIGQTVAVRARAAGMRITYVDTRGDMAVPEATSVPSLEAALAQADFVSLHVDLNETTHHLMGAEEFHMMKPTAYFINTARGSVVDQTALVDALGSGAIAGAGLDVLEVEPPEPDDPILTAPNVVIVPHIGSATTETRAAMAQRAVDNLLAHFVDA